MIYIIKLAKFVRDICIFRSMQKETNKYKYVERKIITPTIGNIEHYVY